MPEQTPTPPVVQDRPIFLFILWEASRDKEPEILAEIAQSFTVLKQYEIAWPQANWAEHFVSFYGHESHIWADKARRNGTGNFRVVIVEDPRATYTYVTNFKKRVYVNANTFEAKRRFRKLVNSKDCLHSSISLAETRSNLAILLGMSLDDFLASVPLDGRVETVITAPPREKGWASLRDLFYILNETVPYARLRDGGAAGAPLELLVSDPAQFAAVTGAAKTSSNPYHAEHVLRVGAETVRFNLRATGDGFLDPKLAADVIGRAVKDADGARVPAPEDRFFTALYRALIHAPAGVPAELAPLAAAAGVPDFAARLAKEGADYPRGLLAAWLARGGYAYCRPLDRGLGYNAENVDKAAKVLALKRPRADLLAAELSLRRLKLHLLAGVNLPNIVRLQLRLGSLFKLDFCVGDLRETGI